MTEQPQDSGEPAVADGVGQPGGPLLTPDPPVPPGGSRDLDLDLEPDMDVEEAAGERVIPDQDVNPDAGTPEPGA